MSCMSSTPVILTVNTALVTQMPSAAATSSPVRNQVLLDPDPNASQKEHEGPQALMLALQERRYNLEHQQEATRSMMASPPFVT